MAVSQVPEQPPGRSRAAAHLIFGVGTGIASTVYGTVAVMATIAAYGTDTHPWKLAGVVASTDVVLWIAHLYAHGLSESISEHRRLRPSIIRHIARREFGIVLAALLPVGVLLLGAAGLLHEDAAVWSALAIGLVTLAVQGARYARLEAVGVVGTFAAVAVNVGLGVVVVLLKVSLTH